MFDPLRGEFIAYVESRDACESAIEWMGDQPLDSKFSDLWNACPNGNWLWWLLAEIESGVLGYNPDEDPDTEPAEIIAMNDEMRDLRRKAYGGFCMPGELESRRSRFADLIRRRWPLKHVASRLEQAMRQGRNAEKVA